MHTLTLTTLTLLSAFATAQIPGLPNCAASCVNDSFGSCGSLDVGCICSNKELLTGLSCCVSKACSKEDQDKTLQFANSICAGQGANNLPTAATCADAASTTASPSATGSSSSASDAAMTTSGSMTSSASGEQTGSSTASDSSTETGSATGSMTSSAESASETAVSATDGASSTTERPAASTGGADGLGLKLGSAGLGVVLAGVAAVM